MKRATDFEAQGDNALPYVTVVIAAYNEVKIIEDKIRNCMALEYPKDKIEILIGSDGSDDGTDDICKKYSDFINFTRIEPRQGKTNVLNTLIPQAKGDIIFLSDANTVVESDSFMDILKPFVNHSIGAVCGRLILSPDSLGVESFEQTYWNYESKIKACESAIFSTIGANGAIYAIRKELFSKIPKDTIIDDFWISMDILEKGKRLYFVKTAIGFEKISDNIVDEFWRKVRIGSGNLQTFIRKPIIRGASNLQVNISFYSHKVIRWLVPFLIVNVYITTLLLSSEYFYSILLRVFNFMLFLSLLGITCESRIKVLNSLSYFFLFNFALLLGYIRYVLGFQSVKWRKAKR